jgi:hypothetical protein
MLLVAVTDLDLQDEAKGAVEAESYSPAIRLKAGDAAWVAGGHHQFKNVGSTQARFVTLEF